MTGDKGSNLDKLLDTIRNGQKEEGMKSLDDTVNPPPEEEINKDTEEEKTDSPPDTSVERSEEKPDDEGQPDSSPPDTPESVDEDNTAPAETGTPTPETENEKVPDKIGMAENPPEPETTEEAEPLKIEPIPPGEMPEINMEVAEEKGEEQPEKKTEKKGLLPFSRKKKKTEPEEEISGTEKEKKTSGFASRGRATPEEQAEIIEAVKKEKEIGFFSKLLRRKVIEDLASKIPEYNFNTHGPLARGEVPEGYVLIDQYWISEGTALVYIVHNDRTNQDEYMLFEPILSEFEYELLERLYEDLRDVLILSDVDLDKDPKKVLFEKIFMLISEYGITLDDDQLYKLEYYLVRNYLGWSRIDPLMKDENIEDISCDGTEIPIFLYHRQYRNVRTNIMFDADSLYVLAITLAQRSGKHISISRPLLDATLPDGSRLQLTLGKEVTTRGTSFTIRKFRETPFSPIELIDRKTFSLEEMVYFWISIENNSNLIFIGGTASGKTSSLNAASFFITPMAKVVSIEDTREITLYHENWIASVTREAVTEAGKSIDMFDLLKAAMRQRPEYILVGEVRGVEAQTLFQAMSTGHTTFSTMHAGDIDAAIHRLENPPLSVPRNMLTALDIVALQGLIYRGHERVRRCDEIVEIAGIDPTTGNLRVNNVFEYDPVTDVHSYTGRSMVYIRIMESRGWSQTDLENEISTRLKILKSMQDQRIIDYISVSQIFQAYMTVPSEVLDNIEDLRKVIE